MKYRFVMPLLAMALWVSPSLAQEEIRLLAPGSAKAGIAALLPAFEAQNNVKVNARYESGALTRKLATGAEDFDIKVVQPPLADILAKGNVVAKSQTLVASAPIGVTVKAGAPHPDISTASAVKKTLLAAKSVSYPDPSGAAAAGASFYATLTKLGIIKEIAAKLKYASGDNQAVANVAKGEAEIGIAFQSESKKPGVDIVGALPSDISPPIQLVGFVSAKSKNAGMAEALLKYLSAPEAAETYRAQGMVPAR